MKNILIITFFLFASCSLFAQNTSSLAGDYRAISDVNNVKWVTVLSLTSASSGVLTEAQVNGLNETKSPISNLVIDNQNNTISFEAKNSTWSGTLVASCEGKYTIRIQNADKNYNLTNVACP